MDVGQDPVNNEKGPKQPFGALYAAMASLANMKGHAAINCDLADWDVLRGIVFTVPFDLTAQGYLEKLTQSAGDDDSVDQMAVELGFPANICALSEMIFHEQAELCLSDG